MPIQEGARLGPYEVLAPLGAGGMGEVYRGRDTRLERNVAIKVLPAGLSENETFRARFEREAKTISSLNHPHICALFDVGQENGAQYLVMELLEGESIADRLSRGPYPPDQVLRYGAQIAEALDRAHQSGIVHRDLKPGNVIITKSGAKLLDFGLARPTSGDQPLQGLTNVATAAKPLTQEGTILGTFQYMAPEQLEGLETDARTDIFALGALLYEMATGRRAFEGNSRTSLIAAIVSSQPPPLSVIQQTAPPALDHVIRKCLEKDPDDRWQSARDVAGELRWISSAGSDAVPQSSVRMARRTRERLAWSVVALLAIALVGSLIYPKLKPRTPASMMRLAVTVPNVRISQAGGTSAISPDGSGIVFIGSDREGRSGLWIRPLSGGTARYLQGTAGATFPFWSPDSRQVAFFASGKLKKMPIDASDADVLADAPDARGGSWSSQGVIVYSPSVSGPLMLVETRGGSARAATVLDTTRGQRSHRFPWFLPDGRHFTFLSESSVPGDEFAFIGSIDSTKFEPLMKTSRSPVYSDPGFLIVGLDGRVVAQRFDARTHKLGTEIVRLSDGLPDVVNTGDRVATASRTGMILLPTSLAGIKHRLALTDRRGNAPTAVTLPEGPFNEPAISPDGTRAIVTSRGSPESHLWLIDLARGTPTRLTFGPHMNQDGRWSPDGKRIVFHSNRSGSYKLYLKQVGGSGEAELPGITTGWQRPIEWSADGRFVTFDGLEKTTGFDIWYVEMTTPPKATRFLATPANEIGAAISPDGRWIAYLSNESGAFELYVQSFPIPGTKYQIPRSAGAVRLKWTRGGRELVYGTNGGELYSVAVTPGDGLEFGAIEKVMTMTDASGNFDLTPDGERLLSIVPDDAASMQSLTVILNWAGLD